MYIYILNIHTDTLSCISLYLYYISLAVLPLFLANIWKRQTTSDRSAAAGTMVPCASDDDCAALPKSCCPHYGPGPSPGCNWLRCLPTGTLAAANLAVRENLGKEVSETTIYRSYCGEIKDVDRLQPIGLADGCKGPPHPTILSSKTSSFCLIFA